MSAAVSQVVTTELATVDPLASALSDLEPDAAAVIEGAFKAMFADARAAIDRAKLIKVTSIDQKRLMKEARELRLTIREKRTDSAKAHKRLKEGFLRGGRALDGILNVMKALTVPVEEYLLEQETFADRAEAAQKETLRSARAEALQAHGADPALYAALGDLTEDQWATALQSAVDARTKRERDAQEAEDIRAAVEKSLADKRAAEAKQRIADEAARIEREKAQIAETARVKKEQAEERAIADAARAKHEAELAKAAKLLADTEAEAAAQRAHAEAQAKAEREAAAEETRKAQAEVKRLEAAQIALAREAKAAAAAEVARLEAEKAALEKEAADRAAADAARVAAEADSRKPTKLKYSLLTRTLEKIACWDEDLATVDEPHAAAKAREVLEAVGLAPKSTEGAAA